MGGRNYYEMDGQMSGNLEDESNEQGCSVQKLYGRGDRPVAGRYKDLSEETQLPNPMFASTVPIASLLFFVQEWPRIGADRHSTERTLILPGMSIRRVFSKF